MMRDLLEKTKVAAPPPTHVHATSTSTLQRKDLLCSSTVATTYRSHAVLKSTRYAASMFYFMYVLKRILYVVNRI